MRVSFASSLAVVLILSGCSVAGVSDPGVQEDPNNVTQVKPDTVTKPPLNDSGVTLSYPEQVIWGESFPVTAYVNAGITSSSHDGDECQVSVARSNPSYGPIFDNVASFDVVASPALAVGNVLQTTIYVNCYGAESGQVFASDVFEIRVAR